MVVWEVTGGPCALLLVCWGQALRGQLPVAFPQLLLLAKSGRQAVAPPAQDEPPAVAGMLASIANRCGSIPAICSPLKTGSQLC